MAIDPLSSQNAVASSSRAPVAPASATVDAAARGEVKAKSVGDDQDMSFWDVLDIVNPLQHIPIVSSVYRAITGDEIKPAMQIGGDILFGGVIGGAASIANAILQEATGKDLGGHVMAGLGFGGDAPGAPPVQVAGGAAPSQAPTGPAPQNPATRQMSPPSPQSSPSQPQAGARPTASAAPPPAAAPTAAEVMAALQGGAGQGAAPPSIPSGGLSGGLAAAAGRAPQGVDPAMVMNSGHIPSKMPKRDAMLASAMPRGSVASNLERAAPVDRTGPVLPPVRTTAAAAARQGSQPAAQQADASQPPLAPLNVAPSREAMSDVMMRNLAKYQSEKRAAAHTMRTSS